jgi:hypothetical protein
MSCAVVIETVESKATLPEAVPPLLVSDAFGAFFLGPILEDGGENGWLGVVAETTFLTEVGERGFACKLGGVYAALARCDETRADLRGE